MKKNRGQVTIFVILAIIIIGGIISFFIIRGSFNIGSNDIPVELSPLTSRIQLCLDTALQDGVKIAGMQGGYVIPPKNSLETNFSYIAYGYYFGKNTLISKVNIQREISKYIELTLPFCVDDSIVPNYKIKFGEINAQTSIDENFVSSSLSLPFFASNNATSIEINKKYSTKYKVDLGKIYLVAQNIISKEIQNPNSIDFSYLNSFNYDISLFNELDDIVVYSITDYKLNDSGSYTFRFANRIK